ncbi:MAG TPA: hypothetical protein EYN93_01510 [Planctomycetaceae bacterium]|nr:hypothetical protein [Planctomycetaceae bacterium]
MSPEIETTDPNGSETDEAAPGTLEESDAVIDLNDSSASDSVDNDLSDSSENDADVIDLDETDDADVIDLDETDDADVIELDETDEADVIELDETADEEEADASMGEWSLCASMIFLTGYLVVVMFWVLGHPVWDTLVSFDREEYRSEFPVGIATILLLISVLSAFCSFISLVADKNNRQTLLIRLLTLGPLLPTATAGIMIWIIIQRGAGNSILETILG